MRPAARAAPLNTLIALKFLLIVARLTEQRFERAEQMFSRTLQLQQSEQLPIDYARGGGVC